MGLDSVELVMDVEDEFQIVIPDAVASLVVTVGMLVDVVHFHISTSTQDPCLSQHGFYVVRKTLLYQLDVPRSSILPDTKFSDLIAKEDRQDVWPRVISSLTDYHAAFNLKGPDKTEFPPGFSRVRDLIMCVSIPKSRALSKEEIFMRIQDITVRNLGVKPDQVTLEARWVEDLHLD